MKKIDIEWEISVIDVKDAVKIATNAMAEFLPQSVHADLALEEVEISDDDKYWFITLGFNADNPDKPPLSPPLLSSTEKYIRKYKIFRIDSESGKLLSMRIRDV